MLNKAERDLLMTQSKALRKTIDKLRVKYFDPEEYGIPVHQYLYREFDKLKDDLLIFE